MYIKKIRLKNIKCFEDVTLEFPHRGDDYSGWIVLLGENGTGKTTLLQAVPAAILSPSHNPSLRLYPGKWVRSGSKEGAVAVEVVLGEQDQFRDHYETRAHSHRFRESASPARSINFAPRYHRLDVASAVSSGWFISGYGPFRRLESRPGPPDGGAFDARFATLFDDSIGLPECDSWLSRIYSNSLDVEGYKDHKKAKRDLASLRSIIQRLLPEGMSLDKITSEGVLFRNREQFPVAFGDLSDGYRAFLSLTIDLLRNIRDTAQDDLSTFVSNGDDDIQVLFDGIVLIDEADAHLHPQWQRQLGGLLTKTFPRIQFIVTTHSPFIAQEATKDGLFLLTATEKGAIDVSQPMDTVQGWPVSQILTSPLFGLESTRDPETEELIRKHAELSARKRFTKKLSAEQAKELEEITSVLERRLTAPGETFADRQVYEEKERYIAETLRHLKNGQ